MNKFTRNIWPPQHGENDFECFGPPAIKDGTFDNTMLVDMGCFKQGETDSNKYLHIAIVKSKKNDLWYLYTEWGRVGTTKDFQFIEFSDKSEAVKEYQKKCHQKNDKRGEWIDRPGLGVVLQAKAGKDCYLVRPQATRSTGLPSAKTIVSGITKVKSNKKIDSSLDRESQQLLDDLNYATTEYTRSSMADNAIPTKDAIEECRNICAEATKINNAGQDLDNKELLELTQLIYSRIPKKKKRKTNIENWLLTPSNISTWIQDLDAFESALDNQEGVVTESILPFNLQYINRYL